MNTIRPNTFAEACFEQNTTAELRDALTGSADAVDCLIWGLTEAEWRQQIKLALAAKLED